MKDTIVSIQGHGIFVIPTDKVQALIAWLKSNQAIGINENVNTGGVQILRG